MPELQTIRNEKPGNPGFFYHSYKLTLLSNNAEGDCGEVMLCSHTKLHYSQTVSFKNCFQLKLCTLTKLHYSQTTFEDLNMFFRFASIQNYTTLKPRPKYNEMLQLFAPLQNYTTLKLYLFHSSLLFRFLPLQNYTTLKRELYLYVPDAGFVPLQNYTTLKLIASKDIFK